MLAPVSRTARFRDQLQLDDESISKIADHCESPGVPDPPPVPGFRDAHMTGAAQPALAVKLVSKAAAGATLGGTWRLLRAGHAGGGQGVRQGRSSSPLLGPAKAGEASGNWYRKVSSGV
eukprot:scaffold1697_cov66-Phaeocystis_antarctica.AAC.1